VIARIWHGWATPEGAAAYERYFQRTLTPELRGLPGFRGANLLRHVADDEVELVTITWFDSLDAVRTFAGEEYEQAVVSEQARALLTRHDSTCRHFELRSVGHRPPTR
jgi:heme-degrading monooxygenase HmoA